MIPPVSSSPVQGVLRFQGHLSDLEQLTFPVLEKPDALYRTLYVPRELETRLLKRITRPGDGARILLYGDSGTGKSMVSGYIERRLRDQGIPVHNILSMRGWAEVKAFLEQHRHAPRVVVMIDELGLLPADMLADELREINQLRRRYPNMAIIASMDTSRYKDLQSKIKTLFPLQKDHIRLAPPTNREVTRMIASALEYCGFTGLTEALQEKLSQIQAPLETRRVLLKLIPLIRAQRPADRPDNRDEIETLPETMIESAFLTAKRTADS